nr:Chain C, caged substrate [synthetic construct]
TKCVIM